MTTDSSEYTYHVHWSEKDKQYVGTVQEFPALRWSADSDTEALAGIQTSVQEILQLLAVAE